VLPPLLLVAVVVAVVAVQDGDSTWLEGGAMITLYAMVATAFWWG
jgi:Ca2+:H+ antiporter